jgi:hypothetical protein
MQGEANANTDGRQYNCSFPALIQDWRAKFHKYTDGAAAADFPFGWAQLNSVSAVSVYKPILFDTTCAHTVGGCAGKYNEWSRGFPSIRLVSGLLVQQVSLVHTNTDYCLPNFYTWTPTTRPSR